jgi:hypothetical protein
VRSVFYVRMSKCRQFPLPWQVRGNESAYWVEDAEGKRFGFSYFRDGGWGTSTGQINLTREEAQRIVLNIRKLPDLLQAFRSARSSPDPASD